jgi:hypothetical protein
VGVFTIHEMDRAPLNLALKISRFTLVTIIMGVRFCWYVMASFLVKIIRENQISEAGTGWTKCRRPCIARSGTRSRRQVYGDGQHPAATYYSTNIVLQHQFKSSQRQPDDIAARVRLTPMIELALAAIIKTTMRYYNAHTASR